MGFYKTSGIKSILKEDVMRSLDYLLTPKDCHEERKLFQKYQYIFSIGKIEDGYILVDIPKNNNFMASWDLNLINDIYTDIGENLMISTCRIFKAHGVYASEYINQSFLLSIKYLQWFNKNIKQNDKETI